MRTRTLTAAAVALMFAITGCGGDDDDEGSSDTVAEPEGGDEGAGAGDDITMSNFAFNPSELTVASGDTISVTNEDGSGHTFTSDDGGFDLSLGSGESGEVTIDADAGSYDFLCTIHPSMTGTLTVE
jgi:plastocyanin